jgi:hypothetical protein
MTGKFGYLVKYSPTKGISHKVFKTTFRDAVALAKQNRGKSTKIIVFKKETHINYKK